MKTAAIARDATFDHPASGTCCFSDTGSGQLTDTRRIRMVGRNVRGRGPPGQPGPEVVVGARERNILASDVEDPGDNGAGLLTISVGQEGEIRAESSIAKDVSST